MQGASLPIAKSLSGVPARKRKNAGGASVKVQLACLFVRVHQDMLAHAQIDVAAHHGCRGVGLERSPGFVVEHSGNAKTLAIWLSHSAGGTTKRQGFPVLDAIDPGG